MLGKEDVAMNDEAIVAKKKCVAEQVTFKHGASVLHFKF